MLHLNKIVFCRTLSLCESRDDDNNDINKSKTIYLNLKSSCRAVDVDGDSSLSSLCDLLQ